MTKRSSPMPSLRSNVEAEAFEKTADLSEYDLSSFRPMRFVVEPKTDADRPKKA